MIDWCCDAIQFNQELIISSEFNTMLLYNQMKNCTSNYFYQNIFSSLKGDKKAYRRRWTPKMAVLASPQRYISTKPLISNPEGVFEISIIAPTRYTWRRHTMEALSALLVLGEGNPPVDFTQRTMWCGALAFFFDVSLNKFLNQQPSCRCFEGSWRSRDVCNVHWYVQ